MVDENKLFSLFGLLALLVLMSFLAYLAWRSSLTQPLTLEEIERAREIARRLP